MNAPKRIRQGDKYTWTESHSDYPASDSWVAKAYIVGPSKIILTAVADESEHDFTLTADESAALSTGDYTIQIRFEKSTDKRTPDGYVANIEVLPGIDTQLAGYDARTHAQKMVDLYEQALIDLAATGNASVTIGGKSVTYQTRQEIRIELNYWQAKVTAEKNGGRRKRILGEFASS